MKKLSVTGMTLALLCVSTAVFAIGGLPSIKTGNSSMDSAVNTAVGDAGKMVVVNETNKWLSQQNCQCDTKTGEITGCDLNAIGAKLNNNKTAMKVAFNRTANIKTEVNQKCYDFLHANLNADNSYYSWVKSLYNKSTAVKITLE